MGLIVDFLKNTILGIVILGAFGSIFAVILTSISKKILIYLQGNNKKSKYVEGFYAGFADKNGTFHQLIYLSRLVLKCILSSFLIVIIIFAFFLIIQNLKFENIWILVLSTSVIISFPVWSLYRSLRYFNMLFKIKFQQAISVSEGKYELRYKKGKQSESTSDAS